MKTIWKATVCIVAVLLSFSIYSCGDDDDDAVGSRDLLLAYIIHSGFISGYQNRYGDNLKPPTNVYHRMTA